MDDRRLENLNFHFDKASSIIHTNLVQNFDALPSLDICGMLLNGVFTNLLFNCILAEFWLHYDRILTAFWLHSDRILTEFWLHSNRILTAF